ncbi:MAG TPA: LysM peptidoglycan-binding domain-containing protein [Flavobacterium sp.]|jgi:LysM repeat protein
MKKYVIILIMAFSVFTAASQEMEQLRYTVEMGETVRMISRKFKIAPSEIYRLNRFAIEGINEGMVLHLVVPKKELKSNQEKKVILAENFEESNAPEKGSIVSDGSVNIEGSQPISHKVEPDETLFSISKKYNVSVEEIKQRNESRLKKGLQPGQVLIIRVNNKMATAE